MNIDSTQQKQLSEALVSAFPTRSDLEKMVLDGLHENLSVIAGDSNLEHTILQLIQWSKAEGSLEKLVKEALQQNPNPQLSSIAMELGLYMKRIKQISVKNLFGLFDHTIPLHLDEHITIIHGPNGFGKTTILKLVQALFDGNNFILRTIPFDEFRVDFSDSTSFWITKTSQKKEQGTTPQMTFHLMGNQSFQWTLTESSQEKQPQWLTDIKKSIPIRFIETQRLLNQKKRRKKEPQVMVPTVTMHAEDLAEKIKAKSIEYSTLAQSLDSAFPKKIVSSEAKQNRLSESELRKKLAELERKSISLVETGLLDQGSSDLQVTDQIDESTSVALSIYVKDTEQKLGIFDDIAKKIDLLRSIINKRFLYKEMMISKQEGFVFTTLDGLPLSLESLSSGEQHELVLFYDLLFKVAPGSLILIDEPEMSLHIVWQEHFFEDIRSITVLSDIDLLLATHSPDIINDQRQLVVELEGPN